MQSLTLSQFPFPCRSPSSSTSFGLKSSTLAPKPSPPLSRLALARCKGKLCDRRFEQLPRDVKPALHEIRREFAHKWSNVKVWTSALKSYPEIDFFTRNDLHKLHCDELFGYTLKFVVLLGLLALQGCEPAAAASDVASGLRSFPSFGDLGDISTGFASAFLLIFFSELGDKTFFIAALLAARNSAAIVFIGTFGALAAMTLISVILGRTFHYVDEILPFGFGGTNLPIDDIAAVFLLVYFGITTLLDASSDDGLKAEDEEKEAELAVSGFSGNGAGIVAVANTIVSTFALVFIAEWGDKSFFSTIALAAASSPLGVIAGSLAGHGVATLLAVLGGSLLGTFLSEKAIAYVGGTLFLVFAAITLIEITS